MPRRQVDTRASGCATDPCGGSIAIVRSSTSLAPWSRRFVMARSPSWRPASGGLAPRSGRGQGIGGAAVSNIANAASELII